MGMAVTETAARDAALRDKTIEQYGLQLRGIKMGRYEEWMKCKNVWLARQATFPVFCISLSFLEALWALDMEAIDAVGKPAGFLYRIMYALGMALGMGENCVHDGNITVSVDEAERKLNGILIRKANAGEDVLITPHKFDKIRKIVAWMQGDDLPDESMNDELLETEKDLAGRSLPNLRYELNDMISSVALGCGLRVKDLLEWSILEFESMRRAVDRRMKYIICGIGETNGCKWDSGNPHPSWCFDKEHNGTIALISQAKFGQMKTNKKE